jgi:glycosyltransferase involved in cell wall biosynthesis
VIVVDDGSTDPHTLSVLDALKRPRTVILRRPNGGLSAARNQGISAARGRYICCLDADDRLAPTYLEKAAALLEADLGIGFVYSWVQLFGDENDIWQTEPFDLAELRRRNYISVAAVFRREHWEVVGGFAEDMRDGYEDWEFWLRLAEGGKRGVLIPEALLEHRLHGRTMIYEAREHHESLVTAIQQRHPRLYRDDEVAAQICGAYRSIPASPPFMNLGHACSTYAEGADTRRGLLALVPWLPAGGAEAVLYAVLSGLRLHHGFDLTIATCNTSKNEWHGRFAALTDEIYHLSTFLPHGLWPAFIHHLLNTRSIDTLLVSGASLGYEMLGEIKRTYPHIRTLDILHNTSPLGHLASSVVHTDDFDYHVAVAPEVARALAQHGVPPEKITLIPNGVDTAVFDPARFKRADARRQWRLGSDNPVLTYIGRLNEEKQPLEFLRLAAELATTPTEFLLIGDGPQREAVEKRIEQADLRQRVKWLRSVPPEQIPSVLAASDALAITSSIEGLPIVMLEALAMNVPVFTYDVGDVRSAVVDGLNGYVFRIGDLAGMSDALCRFVSDPDLRDELRRGPRRSLIERGFTLAALQAAYGELVCGPAHVPEPAFA